MKNLISVFIAVAILIAVATMPISAESVPTATYKSGEFEYTLYSSYATICGYAGSESTLNIPQALDGYTVISIENNVFYDCDFLKEITIPDKVTRIGQYTFANCDNLSKITLPDSLKTIQNYAFSRCVSLTEVTIPDSVTQLNKAFEHCTSLKEVKLSNSLTEISSFCFSYCSSLKNIVIPDSVKTIGSYAFYSAGLTSITIPDSVTKISNNAFGSTNISEINIPASVISIEKDAFIWCCNLTKVSVDTKNPVYDSRNNCNAIIETATDTLLYGCKNTIIPDDIVIIENTAFSGCGIENFTIPDTCISVGEEAFTRSKTTKITIPDSVENIGYAAFYECENATELALGKSLKTIGDWAFSKCNLTQVVIPESVDSIGCEAFWGNPLEKVTILNPKCEIYDNDYTFAYTTVIYGYNNSTAQEYAETYNRPFVSLGDYVTIGDVDNDGDINIIDATLIQRAVAKYVTLTDLQYKSADTDNDGKITIMDTTAIQRYIAKIITEFKN